MIKIPHDQQKNLHENPRGGSYSASGMAIPSPTRSPWRGARAENHQRWPERLGMAPYGGFMGDQRGYFLVFFWNRTNITSQLDVI